MKYLLIALLFDAQAGFTQTPSINKWSIGANFSLDENYRVLVEKDIRNGYSNKEFRDSKEVPLMGFTSGLFVQYHLTPKLMLSGGIQYSQKGYEVPKYTFTFGLQIPSDPRAHGFTCKYKYLDVPFQLRYTVGNKRLKFVAGGGLALNLLIETIQHSEIYYDNHSEVKDYDRTSDYNRFNLSPMLSAGVSYQITPKVNLLAEPTFRMQVLNNTNAYYSEYLYNSGLNISAFYKL